ncbi:Ras- protein Rab-28 [Rhizoclosmatium sp. JEL0117]|nr:Ras- protein Rab-28 [Rhizoclosmatium sp. JEL0117]
MLAPQTITLRIALVGDGASGKTAIARRFTNGTFVQEYKQTVGLDIYSKQTSIAQYHSNTCDIELWDVGSQTLTSKSFTNFIHAVDVILFVYDVTHVGSLRGLEDWIKYVYACKLTTDTCLPMFVLVANKNDLVSSRTVKPERHRALAEYHGIPSFYVSAKTGDNVSDMFLRIAFDLCDLKPLTVDNNYVITTGNDAPTDKLTVVSAKRKMSDYIPLDRKGNSQVDSSTPNLKNLPSTRRNEWSHGKQCNIM